jgi:hypothetical protein
MTITNSIVANAIVANRRVAMNSTADDIELMKSAFRSAKDWKFQFYDYGNGEFTATSNSPVRMRMSIEKDGRRGHEGEYLFYGATGDLKAKGDARKIAQAIKSQLRD